jgi:DNA (cytosine-5)-methyltransferase 1
MNSLWAYRKGNPVPVIDLFAGPGGLGEGFSRAGDGALFKIALSVEMDRYAHETLTLRAFQRSFGRGAQIPDAVVDLMRGHRTLDDVLAQFPDQAQEAKREAFCLELGPKNKERVFELIRERLEELGTPGRWVLIGGPPCQAYSLAGRARRSRALNSGEYVREKDKRHFLFREYLKILAEFKPAVFVMENVKGILSSEVNGKSIFSEIYKDLQNPERIIGSKDGVRYRLVPLAPISPALFDAPTAKSFIVRAEDYGIPQSRHRVIIVGVRSDIELNRERLVLKRSSSPTCVSVLGDLPKIRSGISAVAHNRADWVAAISKAPWKSLIDGTWQIEGTVGAPELREAVRLACGKLERASFGEFETGTAVYEHCKRSARAPLPEWCGSNRTGLIFNHQARSHMVEDLRRYFFCAVFAQACRYSPTLSNFPQKLLPDHANAQLSARNRNLFADRFRVQMSDRVSTTVTSHISKDGHGFIHYDPAQCRALTVREAARLQTFPDDYCFLGPRTAQYHQVGNAVPPYLASQIAEAIAAATGCPDS